MSLGIEPTVTVLLGKIEKYLAEGYHRTKVKIKPGWDIEVLREIRRHYPDITLTVDANSDYTLADIDLFRAMDDLNLQYIEQPLAEDDILDHAVLQKAIKTPVCLDESIVSYDTARHASRWAAAKSSISNPVVAADSASQSEFMIFACSMAFPYGSEA